MNCYSKKFPEWIDPEIIFDTLFAKEKYAFWLDSNRFSFMGDMQGSLAKHISYSISSKTVTIVAQGRREEEHISIFDYLEKELGRDALQCVSTNTLPFDFVGGYVGYFGYELQSECGSQQFHQSDLPDASFLFVDRFLAFDHTEKKVYLVCLSEKEKGAEEWFDVMQLRIANCELSNVPVKESVGATLVIAQKKQVTNSRTKQQYIQDIKKCQEYLRKGECYQICLTNQMQVKKGNLPEGENLPACRQDIVSPLQNWFSLYKNLQRINPAPYSAYLCFEDFAILSSSPELFLQIDAARTITSKPMKGTIRRGSTCEEDDQLAQSLKKTQRYFSENAMIVDLVRNDLGRVCDIGSISVSKFLDVETYATVHQLVSTVMGKLRDNVSVIAAIKACFPGGSMTGAPKLQAMKVIASLEGQARGIYSGALGFVSLNGTAALSMVIRTIIATEERLQFGAGGAILVESDPEIEYEEMVLKTKALKEAISSL